MELLGVKLNHMKRIGAEHALEIILLPQLPVIDTVLLLEMQIRLLLQYLLKKMLVILNQL
jgi:hypothetical protein